MRRSGVRISSQAPNQRVAYRYASRGFKGTAETADEALRELSDEVTGGDHDDDVATFGSLLDHWLKNATVLKDLSPTTVREHQRTMDKTIKPVLGDVDLGKLDGRTLDDVYTSLHYPSCSDQYATRHRRRSLGHAPEGVSCVAIRSGGGRRLVGMGDRMQIESLDAGEVVRVDGVEG
jgi:hypothetical protein